MSETVRRKCNCSKYVASGQAFTEFTCANCLRDLHHANTYTARICVRCSRKKKYKGRCLYCLGVIQ